MSSTLLTTCRSCLRRLACMHVYITYVIEVVKPFIINMFCQDPWSRPWLKKVYVLSYEHDFWCEPYSIQLSVDTHNGNMFMWGPSTKEGIGSNASGISYCTIRCVQVIFAVVVLVGSKRWIWWNNSREGALAKQAALTSGILSTINVSSTDNQYSKSEQVAPHTRLCPSTWGTERFT